MKPYTTKDLGLAAFLYLSGLSVLKTVPSSKKSEQLFVFIDDERRADLVDAYFSQKEVTISPERYYWAMRKMKRLLQDPWSPNE